MHQQLSSMIFWEVVQSKLVLQGCFTWLSIWMAGYDWIFSDLQRIHLKGIDYFESNVNIGFYWQLSFVHILLLWIEGGGDHNSGRACVETELSSAAPYLALQSKSGDGPRSQVEALPSASSVSTPSILPRFGQALDGWTHDTCVYWKWSVGCHCCNLTQSRCAGSSPYTCCVSIWGLSQGMVQKWQRSSNSIINSFTFLACLYRVSIDSRWKHL